MTHVRTSRHSSVRVSKNVRLNLAELPDSHLLTTEELAELLSLAVATVVGWRSRRPAHAIPFIRLGARCVRYRVSDVRDYLERFRIVA